MGDPIIYLEKYIDSTNSLPAELNRILNSIKDLDERSDDLAAQIQENVDLVLKMPSGGGSSGRKSAGGAGAGGESEELAALRAQIESDQRLLIQFAEEKVQLAVQGYDLLEQHLGQADLDIVHLEAELQQAGVLDMMGGAVSMGAPDYSGGTFDDPAPKRGGSRLRDVPSFDSFEAAAPAAEPKPPPRKTTITLNLGSRQLSGFEGGPAAAAVDAVAHTPGVDSLGPSASYGQGGIGGSSTAQKRPSAGGAAARKAPTPTPQPAAPPGSEGGGGYQRNRRAAAAGVHAVAAEVAAMEEDDLAPEEQHMHMQHQAAARGGGGGMQQMQQGAPAPTHGRTSAEVAQMFQEREPLIPGLNHASDRPQAPGRLITLADINAGLIGRHAELYWPDDNLWYLIKIQNFDPVTRKASILYTTGEAEELSLDDILKEGHMMLHT